jgi:hypothetical protein
VTEVAEQTAGFKYVGETENNKSQEITDSTEKRANGYVKTADAAYIKAYKKA